MISPCTPAMPVTNSFIIQNCYFSGVSSSDQNEIVGMGNYGRVVIVNSILDMISPSSKVLLQFSRPECYFSQVNELVFENNTVTSSFQVGGDLRTESSFMIYVVAQIEDFDEDIDFRVVFSGNIFTGVVIRNPLL